MAIIYANNNELKALDDRVSALPDPVPPTPIADYYRHKVTISGTDTSGHFYYTSTNNGTVQAATTPSDWYDNVYSKDGFVSFQGAFEGTAMGEEQSCSIMKVVCASNPEEGTSYGALVVAYYGGTPFLIFGFDSVVTDELVD